MLRYIFFRFRLFLANYFEFYQWYQLGSLYLDLYERKIYFMSQHQQQQTLLLPNANNKARSQDKISFFALFKHADQKDRQLMILGTLFAIGAGIASPLFMIFFSTISQIFIPGNQSQAEAQGRSLFVKLFIVGILTWISHAIAMWAWNKSGSRQAARLKKLYFQALLKQQISWYDSTDTSKITTEISQNTLAIETAIGQKIAFTITTLTISAFGFIFSIVKCWQMSLYLAIFLPVMLIAGYLFMKSLSMKAQTGKISYESAANVAQTAFGAIKTIKMLVGEKFQLKKFSNALQSCQSVLMKHLLYSSMSSGFMNLIMMGLYSFGFFIGKQMMIDNPNTYKSSQIISTFFCFMVAGQSIGQISPIFKNIADAKLAYQKIYKIMNRQQTLKQNQAGTDLKNVQSIQLKNVSFSYKNLKQLQAGSVQSTKLALQNITLKLMRGTVTAIVGSSGCGKSTICQLLLHYYGANQGNIQVNGIDIKNLNTYQLRKKIGYVGQQPVLFSMSIKQNIKLTNPQISDSEIQQVLKKAYAIDFVNKLEGGVDTYVGSKGAQLSGGQKQRIAIARALAKYPDLIIFDEATSALDQHSERYVQKTISKLVEENAIVLVVAHRLSSIKDADNIIVLQNGKIIQTGKHQQLIKQKNTYYKLFYSQLENNDDQDAIDQKQTKMTSKQPQNQQTIKKQQTKGLQNKQTNHQDKNMNRNRFQIYKNLLQYAKGYKRFLLLGSIFALINGLVYPFFNVTFSTLMGLMANPQQNNSQINWYCIAFLIIAIVGALSNFGHTLLYGYFGQKLVKALRIKIFAKILRFRCDYFDKKENTPGSISVKLSQDSYQLHNALTGFMSVIFLNLSTIIMSLTFAFIFSWKLTLILLIFSPLMAAKGAIQSSVMKRMSKKSEQMQKSVGSFISDTINNIKTVKSFGGYDQFLAIFNQNVSTIQGLTSSKFLKMGILQGFSRSSAILSYSIIFWVAAALFANNQFSEPKDALVAIFCIIFSATTVGQNSQLMPDLVKAEIAANSILNTLQTKDQFQIAKQTQLKILRKHKLAGNIQFKNVNFKYPTRNQQVLNNLNLHIKQGQKLAIVGSSGSGKSTLIHILARLYPIASGMITIDGYEIQTFNLTKLRKKLGILGQQPTIFKGTIKQNILYRFEDNQKYHNRFLKYCNICCVDHIVEQLEKKYQHQVGQRGSLISGGQKQRIAIARCLIRKPNILIMDEPTSALDVQNQQKIFNNLSKLLKNKTLLYTAHRLSTIKNADKIAVMNQGQISEIGTYQQLLQLKKQFYNLVHGSKSQSLQKIRAE